MFLLLSTYLLTIKHTETNHYRWPVVDSTFIHLGDFVWENSLLSTKQNKLIIEFLSKVCSFNFNYLSTANVSVSRTKQMTFLISCEFWAEHRREVRMSH